jgi:hypothetical protein
MTDTTITDDEYVSALKRRLDFLWEEIDALQSEANGIEERVSCVGRR